MRFHHVITACLSLALLGACDSSDAKTSDEAAVATATPLEPGKTAASFQLQAVVELVKGETVTDAATLEEKINDPEAKLNAVDLDGDGTTDYVEVIETKKGGKTVLEFRAIPSSKKKEKPAKVGVVIATVSFEVDDAVKDEAKLVVHGTYTEHIEHDVHVHVYHHEEPAHYEHGKLVVAEGCFFHYVFVHHHEPYHGHFHYIVIDHDVHVHHKHKKHKYKKGKGHHKGHGKGHGGHGVVVTF